LANDRNPLMVRAVCKLVFAVFAVCSAVAGALPPPHVAHRLAGGIWPDTVAQGTLTLTLDCIMYGSGYDGDADTCGGRLRCDGRGCPVVSGSVLLEAFLPHHVGRPLDPSWSGKMTLHRADGSQCTFTGTIPYRQGFEIPAFAGRYECAAGDGTPLGGGLFGVRARFVGKPYTNFN
jgi:hypothetical protein